jgi:HPt (histidine-containing phosphotransfer) domain-containing protein
MDPTPNLDPAALERLQRLGNAEFVGKMIDLFLQYCGQKLSEANAAHAAGNLTGVEKAVHPIKSSAGNVGARRIQELALQIEGLARQGRGDAVTPALKELELAFSQVKPELEAARRSFGRNPPS